MAGRKIVLFGWADSVHIQRWATGLKNRGFHIKLISLGRKPVADVETVIIPRTSRLSYFTQASRAVRECRAFEPDLVHAHYLGGFGFWALRASFHPTVVSAWGSDVAESTGNVARRLLLHRILTRADRITCPSKFLSEQILHLVPEVESRLSRVPFGVSMPDRASEFPPDEPVRICFFKALMPRYGPDILLEALALVRRTIPGVQLTIAGRGEMDEYLRKMAADLNLAGNVNFAGYVDNRRIYSFIREHHFSVMPSLEESFGVAAVESAACGRAMVASRIGGIPEVVVDGETGLLTPAGNVEALADAITRLGSDLSLCRKLGEQGRAVAERQFDWEKSLDLMTELYEKAIHEAKKR